MRRRGTSSLDECVAHMSLQREIPSQHVTNSLISLSKDVLGSILQFIPLSHRVARLPRVCKDWRDFIQNDIRAFAGTLVMAGPTELQLLKLAQLPLRACHALELSAVLRPGDGILMVLKAASQLTELGLWSTPEGKYCVPPSLLLEISTLSRLRSLECYVPLQPRSQAVHSYVMRALFERKKGWDKLHIDCGLLQHTHTDLRTRLDNPEAWASLGRAQCDDLLLWGLSERQNIHARHVVNNRNYLAFEDSTLTESLLTTLLHPKDGKTTRSFVHLDFLDCQFTPMNMVPLPIAQRTQVNNLTVSLHILKVLLPLVRVLKRVVLRIVESHLADSTAFIHLLREGVRDIRSIETKLELEIRFWFSPSRAPPLWALSALSWCDAPDTDLCIACQVLPASTDMQHLQENLVRRFKSVDFELY